MIASFDSTKTLISLDGIQSELLRLKVNMVTAKGSIYWFYGYQKLVSKPASKGVSGFL
jgi:hypothetical protein